MTVSVEGVFYSADGYGARRIAENSEYDLRISQ
jgi:hypothetical protein